MLTVDIKSNNQVFLHWTKVYCKERVISESKGRIQGRRLQLFHVILQFSPRALGGRVLPKGRSLASSAVHRQASWGPGPQQIEHKFRVSSNFLRDSQHKKQNKGLLSSTKKKKKKLRISVPQAEPQVFLQMKAVKHSPLAFHHWFTCNSCGTFWCLLTGRKTKVYGLGNASLTIIVFIFF